MENVSWKDLRRGDRIKLEKGPYVEVLEINKVGEETTKVIVYNQDFGLWGMPIDRLFQFISREEDTSSLKSRIVELEAQVEALKTKEEAKEEKFKVWVPENGEKVWDLSFRKEDNPYFFLEKRDHKHLVELGLIVRTEAEYDLRTAQMELETRMKNRMLELNEGKDPYDGERYHPSLSWCEDRIKTETYSHYRNRYRFFTTESAEAFLAEFKSEIIKLNIEL